MKKKLGAVRDIKVKEAKERKKKEGKEGLRH
jgi:hypothetical protein